MFEIGAICGSGFEAANQEALKPCGSDPSWWVRGAKICGLVKTKGSHRYGIWGDTSRLGLVALLGCCVATSSEKDFVECWSTEHEVRERRYLLNYG
jgi:hypothetical protein